MQYRWSWLLVVSVWAGHAHADLPPVWTASWPTTEAASDGRITAIGASGEAAAFGSLEVFSRTDNHDHATLIWTRDAGMTVQALQETGGSRSGGAVYRADGNIVSVVYRSADGADCDNNALNCVVSISAIDTASTATLWEVTAAQTDRPWFLDYIHRLAMGTDGTSYWLEGDGGDYVVLRTDIDGNVLPEWRWSTGSDSAVPTDIAVLDDGGALVTGYNGDLHGGYLSVRFDIDGAVVFTDTEFGESGSELSPSAVIRDSNGDFVLAATPESTMGVAQLSVWKVGADGSRRWTQEWITEMPGNNTEFGGLALTPTGDAIVNVDTSFPPNSLQLLRFAAADGTLVSDQDWSDPTQRFVTTQGIAMAPNGRVLTPLLRLDDSTSHTALHLAEWGDGYPCRFGDDSSAYGRQSLVGSTAGWTTIGFGGDSTLGRVDIHRYDADMRCNLDHVFSSGFD